MAPPLQHMFLVLAVLALPNLYYNPEYNVPLMLFSFIMWTSTYKPMILYLLLISWFVDAWRFFHTLSHSSD